jgi:hypothetical protein
MRVIARFFVPEEPAPNPATIRLLGLVFAIMTIYQTATPERATPQKTSVSAADDVRTIMFHGAPCSVARSLA